ncbi:BSP-domain-containing protein [Aulographum hederae CBS 113979]|uniref:BSP-domain-containing protein n=1 Tax=Aulographum hederae CBS 113979 TaxID=1176131 RepID=A0A6G1HH86_9PEZI|nr:BSP-domain-containing protein [Aulographum hederae CBS 113979]
MPPLQSKYFQLPMSPAQPLPSQKPIHNPKTPCPLLRLELRDLSSDGARTFLTFINAAIVLQEAIDGIFRYLYTENCHVPTTRSVTLVLRSMPGVAYTTAKDLDNDHKEIHFSTDYIEGIAKERKEKEMLGVIRHEMVHCFQWDAEGSAPGGLIEGIADWVRLKSDLVPPHWKQEANGDWDAGYQHTGYFLEYLEETYGEGSVVSVNEKLSKKKYEEHAFWRDLFGKEVLTLWKEYGKKLEEEAEAKGEALNSNKAAEKEVGVDHEPKTDLSLKDLNDGGTPDVLR